MVRLLSRATSVTRLHTTQNDARRGSGALAASNQEATEVSLPRGGAHFAYTLGRIQLSDWLLMLGFKNLLADHPEIAHLVACENETGTAIKNSQL